MKRNLKKVTVIMAIVLALMLLLQACVRNTSEKEGDNQSDIKTEQGEGSKDTLSKSDKPIKLKLLGQSGSNKFIKFEDREEYPVWQELKKMIEDANLDLEYEIIPREQYTVVIQTRMASASNLPDIANISVLDNTTALNLAQQKVIIELNPLIDNYSNGNIKRMYNEIFPLAPKLTTAPDGKMYWFSNLHKMTYKNTEPGVSVFSMLIRKDWLEKLNIEEPENAEEYFNALKTMREQDANRNGKADEVLYYNPSGFNGAIAQWFGLGTGITAIDFENNKVISPWYQPGIKEYFKYLNQLVKEEILDTSLIGVSGEKKQQVIIENKIASLSDYSSMGTLAFEPLIKQEKAEYMPLMPLKAVEGITPAVQLEPSELVWQKYAITKACKNQEAAIAFFDIVYSDKYATLCQWGIEDFTYKVENGIKLLSENLTFEEQAKQRKARGRHIYGDTVFPRVQIDALERELALLPEYKVNYHLDVMYHKPYFCNFNDNFLSIPSKEQLDEKTRILNNLNTYSSELAINLALGQASLDNWDKYIEELKTLGLDKLIDIEQQLFERYNSVK